MTLHICQCPPSVVVVFLLIVLCDGSIYIYSLSFHSLWNEYYGIFNMEYIYNMEHTNIAHTHTHTHIVGQTIVDSFIHS